MRVITRHFSETIFSEHLEPKSDINCNGGRKYEISDSCIEDPGPNSHGLHHLLYDDQ